MTLAEQIAFMEGLETGKAMVQPSTFDARYAESETLSSIMGIIAHTANSELAWCGYTPAEVFDVSFRYSPDMEKLDIKAGFTVPERAADESDIPGKLQKHWKEGAAVRAEWEKSQSR